MSMSAGALVSLEEYLNTSYSPDREYVDAVAVERNVGERPHSLVLGNIVFALQAHNPEIFVWPAQRVRTIANRTRIPDVCVTLEVPIPDVFDTPPFICIEILSRRDEMSRILEKLEEYQTFGVPHIWVFDPRRRKAYVCGGGKLEEHRGDALTTDNPQISLPLEDVFRNL
jgi:Uma2 family endonuclease